MPIHRNQNIDFLIVGQGLAGSLLAWDLIKNGCSVAVVDPCLEQTASRAAAGIINPVTGKRLVKTDGVDSYLPTAIALFDVLSDFFGVRFFHPKPLHRLFKSDDEKEQWKKRFNQLGYDGYIGNKVNVTAESGAKYRELPGFEQKQCGHLDTVLLLDTLRKYFKQKDCFVNAALYSDELTLSATHVSWGNYKVNTVVFCNGYELQKNKWFSWLPMYAVQGEVLTLETSALIPEQIIQFGKWLLPLGNNQFKLGATWQWSPLDLVSNPDKKSELLDACSDYFPNLQGAKIVQHHVGVRPGTKDRKPFLGRHPHSHHLAVFNGFGSKGSLMIPWYSQHFSRFLMGQGAIPPHSDIKRYADDCPTG